MHQVVDQITDQLVGLIKKDQPHYTPQQLLRAELPSYIVERVRLYLEDKISEDFKKPESKWVDTETKLIEQGWNDFLKSAKSHSVVLHDDLYGVLNHVVGEIISVFLEPRKNMASYLFREDSVLGFEEMNRRCERLTIYKHFGTAIPLYMKKRNLEEISLERCQQLIRNLDARIVSNYTAEDWAQKLDMLFKLFGGKLEPDLLRIFFEDKGFNQAAKVFSNLDVAVTQSTFIEMLSNENLEKAEAEKPAKDKKPEAAEQNSSLMDSFYSDQESEKNSNIASFFEAGVTDEEMNDILGDIAEGGVIEVDNTAEVESLNALFGGEDEELAGDTAVSTDTDDDDDMKEFRTNLTSILDQAKNAFEGVVNEGEEETEIIEEEELIEESPEEDAPEENTPDETVTEETSDEEAEKEEKPMWAQFLSEDQMAVMMGSRDKESESEEESLVVEDEDDELIIEDAAPVSSPEEEAEPAPELLGYLRTEESKWVDILFGGEKKSYLDSVSTLEGFSSWDEATEFVHNDIIKKNGVDMFSEESIEFIDALQNYFSNHKS